MRIVCGPSGFDFASHSGDLDVVLFGRDPAPAKGSVGGTLGHVLRRNKLIPERRALDLLSVALAVTAADLAGHRDASSDGWTRQFDLVVAVGEPDFWATQAVILERLLQFLTTDRWRIAFVAGAHYPTPPAKHVRPAHDSVVLVSGGLDSFIGALDLVAQGRSPYAVSQSVRGDARRQRCLTAIVGCGSSSHLQLNHNAVVPNPENPPSQRARSVVFFSYGVLAATTLQRYTDGDVVPVYVCENGFISLNPPLTPLRVGSLSTRTSHPLVLRLFQEVVDSAGLRVQLENPYAYQTKGEMLQSSLRQADLKKYAHTTTSCGRFKRFSYRHCGRCVPCLIRRAAFHAWQVSDQTDYVYSDLSIDDAEHARFDDVRAVAMATAEVAELGLDEWLGVSLNPELVGTHVRDLRAVLARGVTELDAFLQTFKIR